MAERQMDKKVARTKSNVFGNTSAVACGGAVGCDGSRNCADCVFKGENGQDTFVEFNERQQTPGRGRAQRVV